LDAGRLAAAFFAAAVLGSAMGSLLCRSVK
jgi:hypothetical protein